MGSRSHHLSEAEHLERQAEVTENVHARAALLRMARSSRGVAALVGMFEACRDEALPTARG